MTKILTSTSGITQLFTQVFKVDNLNCNAFPRWTILKNTSNMSPLHFVKNILKVSNNFILRTILNKTVLTVVDFSCGNYLWFIRPSCLSLFRSMFPRISHKNRTVSMATYYLCWVAIVHMSNVTRKPFLRVCDQVRLKPACSDVEAWNFSFSKYRHYTI